MTTVAVTGASGKLGRHVVRDLHEHGYRVVALDRVPDPGSPAERRSGSSSPTTARCWRRSPRSTTGTRVWTRSCIWRRSRRPGWPPTRSPSPTTSPPPTTSSPPPAARAIRNIVWASSETVLGLPFDTPPPYIPVDEEYPPRPESTYSLVKTLEEEMARHFCRWDPDLKMIGLRFSNVMDPEDYARFARLRRRPRLRRWNLWAYIDGRDGAQAVRLALQHDAVGVDVFVIANADTVMSRRSTDLAAEVYPGVPVTRELGEHETMLSIDKARRVLGYEPQHGWRR